MIPDKAEVLMKSEDMRRLYKLIREKKIIKLEDIKTIYVGAQHSKVIRDYFIVNRIIKEIALNTFEFIFENETEHNTFKELREQEPQDNTEV